MLRLELKDNNETVLFIDPMKGVKIRKEESKVEVCYELCIVTSSYSDVFYAAYDSKEDRDAAYEYVLTKINEYLFPQIETAEFRPICPNDAAMPEYLRKPKE